MTTWIKEELLAGQIPITYNESGVTYNDIRYNYNGKKVPLWDTDNRNITSWSNEVVTPTTWTNETQSA